MLLGTLLHNIKTFYNPLDCFQIWFKTQQIGFISNLLFSRVQTYWYSPDPIFSRKTNLRSMLILAAETSLLKTSSIFSLIVCKSYLDIWNLKSFVSPIFYLRIHQKTLTSTKFLLQHFNTHLFFLHNLVQVSHRITGFPLLNSMFLPTMLFKRIVAWNFLLPRRATRWLFWTWIMCSNFKNPNYQLNKLKSVSNFKLM